jgi:hypothetical protein
MNKTLLRRLMALAIVLLLQTGCTVIAVADAATSVAVTAVKVGVKAVSTAVDAVTPNSDKDKK